MALVEPDHFVDTECVRVYIAGRLGEAKRVEHALTDGGIDYFVAIETFERLLFGVIRREYEGVAFYVPIDRAVLSRDFLRRAKLIAGLEI
jgi:hypothetical protein